MLNYLPFKFVFQLSLEFQIIFSFLNINLGFTENLSSLDHTFLGMKNVKTKIYRSK